MTLEQLINKQINILVAERNAAKKEEPLWDMWTDEGDMNRAKIAVLNELKRTALCHVGTALYKAI